MKKDYSFYRKNANKKGEKKVLLFLLLNPFSCNDLVHTPPVPEGFIDTTIEVVIKLPVPRSRSEYCNPVFCIPVPVTCDDLIGTSSISERFVDDAIEVVIKVPVAG